MKMKELRIKKGLTQYELGKLLDTDSNSIARIERTGKCRLEMAYCIAKILGCTIEEIFFNETKEKKTSFKTSLMR